MNKRNTLADKAFAIFDELLEVETLLIEKCCVGLGFNLDKPEQWSFEFIEIDYEGKTVIFEYSDDDFTLSQAQQNVLWELGFVSAAIYYDVGTEVYTSNLDSK